jgi:hypothetical protein
MERVIGFEPAGRRHRPSGELSSPGAPGIVALGKAPGSRIGRSERLSARD